MTDVVIVSGSPGSGKSTVTKTLARNYEPSVHLHTDDFWHNIVVGGIPPYLPEADAQNQTVVEVTAAAAFGYAAGGFTTFVDGVVGPWMLRHYLSQADNHTSVDLHYVVLRPSRDTALDRAQRRTTAEALTDEDPILALWDQFAHLGVYEHHVVDSTHLSVDDTVEAVRRTLASDTARISNTSGA